MHRSIDTSMSAGHERPTVFIVDPDPAFADFARELVESHHLEVEVLATGEEFWNRLEPTEPGCALVEVELPGVSGIQLQERMTDSGLAMPVIMTATEADVAVAVRAMKLGAIDFMLKPCHPLELWESVQQALDVDCQRRSVQCQREAVRERLQQLTDHERQIVRMMLKGHTHKAIASKLGVSLRTIDFRRASIFQKMNVCSVIELAQVLVHVEEHSPKTAESYALPVAASGASEAPVAVAVRSRPR